MIRAVHPRDTAGRKSTPRWRVGLSTGLAEKRVPIASGRMVPMTTLWVLPNSAVAPLTGTSSHARPQTLVQHPTVCVPSPGTGALAALDHPATGVGPTGALAAAA